MRRVVKIFLVREPRHYPTLTIYDLIFWDTIGGDVDYSYLK